MDETREWIRAGCIGAAQQLGATRVECPAYPRCYYAVITKDSEEAEAMMTEHLATDPRHTGGEWIDRDGNTRIGLD